jgi:hypothetical protein
MKLKARILMLAILITATFFTVSSSSANEARTFQGCWTFFPAGQCRAIYKDNNNNYFICGNCDASGNPGGGKCSSISSQTLNQGYWCS